MCKWVYPPFSALDSGPPSDEDSENNPLPESGCYLQIFKFIPLNLLAF